jgi:uncharacterized protein
MIVNLMSYLFMLSLVAGIPVLSLLTARPERLRQVPRAALYISAVLSQWLLAALGGVVVWATLPGLQAAGFRAISSAAFLSWSFLATAACFAAIGVMALLENLGWWPPEPETSRILLPETRREKILAVLLVAPSAGFCEEFLYRGYLMPQLSRYPSSVFWGWLVSSVGFALAHSYQGLSGILQAAVLGGLLAYPVVRLGSVYPSMTAHAIIDALLLVWLGRKLLRPTPDPEQSAPPADLTARPDTDNSQFRD